PLVDEELGAATAGRALEQPAEGSRRWVAAALDAPARLLDERSEVARCQPAQVRLVTVTGLRVAERPAEDEVAHERPVAGVGHRDVKQRLRGRERTQPAQHRGRV